jgi:hypothetical protein
MKSQKHIAFRLLFLIIVLFCLALEVYAYNRTPVINTELSSDLNYMDNSVSTNVDSFEDDHINQTHLPVNFVKQLITISLSKDSLLLKEFTISSWKPPRIT